jgi:antitoxin VapB
LRLFQNGRSQAVRLPREFRFAGDRVRVRRVGRGVLIEPMFATATEWFTEHKHGPDPFMGDGRSPSKCGAVWRTSWRRMPLFCCRRSSRSSSGMASGRVTNVSATHNTLVAGQARRLGATLVTSNSADFDRVHGLMSEDWSCTTGG